jgi:transposase
VIALARENSAMRETERSIILFMAHVAQGHFTSSQLSELVPKQSREIFLDKIAPGLASNSRCYRNRTLVLTFYLVGVNEGLISEFVGYTRWAVRRFARRFENGDHEGLFAYPERQRKYDDKALREALFATLHEPPSEYGINRTTWTIDLLHEVLKSKGILIAKNAMGRIFREEGYSRCKTREVLTSNDPDYREKLIKITRTLRRLGPMDRFFSIDEYGPVSVRERGGRLLVKRGTKPTIPQYQDSKGFLIVTAALELSRNQITYFYSKKKDTEEMIKLLHVLLHEYFDCRRLYLSWDAASWHSSKKFLAEVKRVNTKDYRNTYQSPMVHLRPLPARAQFLNVIESVFSGLSQSVIHNSNYASVDEAKAAIDRYIAERNEFFRANRRKAGNKIWGEEQVPSYFSVSHNCKDPRFAGMGSIR